MTKLRDKVSNFLINIAKKLAGYVYNDVNRVLDVVKWICIASILLTGLTLLSMSKDMKARESTYSSLKQGLQYGTEKLRHSTISETYSNVHKDSLMLRDKLRFRIAEVYKDKRDALSTDLTTYVSTNDMQNPLFRIFSDESFTYERALMANTNDCRIIITDRRNVLFSTFASEPLRKVGSSALDVIFSKPQDKYVVFDEKKDLVTLMYIDELAENLREFPHLKVLAPNFIHEHEDLLGVRDVYPDGSPANNYKLAVIIAYDPIKSETYSTLTDLAKLVKASKDEEQWLIIKQGSTWIAVWGTMACIFGFAWHTVSRYKKQ